MLELLRNLVAVLCHAARPSAGSSSSAPAPAVDLDELARRLAGAICVYCERPTGTEYDEHEECVEASLNEALELELDTAERLDM